MYHVRGSCSFELQPRTQGDGTSDLPDDGLLSDEGRAKRKKTRGSEKRTQYSNRKKAAVVAELRELEADHAEKILHVHGVSCQQFLARTSGIPQPNICKWNGDAEKLIAAAVNDLKNDLVKTGRQGEEVVRRRREEAALAAAATAQEEAQSVDSLDSSQREKARGRNVSGRLACNELFSVGPVVQEVREAPPSLETKAHKHEEQADGGPSSADEELPQEAAPAAAGTTRSPGRCWGRRREQRRCDRSCGIAPLRALQPECAFQCRPDRVHFPRQRQVPAVEKAAYDPGVDVLFQENAWMDGPTCMTWAKHSFLSSMKGEEGVVPEEQSILFADNLHAQTTDDFKKFLHGECNTLLRLLPPKLTDELQPVDAGYGRLLKVEVGNELDEFLGHEENLCLWETNKLSAGARRILFTRFIARAVARMDARPGYRHRLFEKTGLAMTADGSLDDRITPEGVVGAYNFMDGGTSSDEEMPDQDDEVGDDDGGAGAGESSCDSDASADDDGDDHGDVQDPLSQQESDDNVDSDDDIIAMELPVGFRLQQSPPEKLDRALIKRCVFLTRGMGWFLGQISRAAPPQTSHTYDYRVVLAYDQSTIIVNMPL
ncbi:unnamed protein product [Ectocarpus sp. CCAP 1310/34]|nr:unnamed protein product [Ectocarpus sp. CCAP 1310/34]